jgi:hypothetical protein
MPAKKQMDEFVIFANFALIAMPSVTAKTRASVFTPRHVPTDQ